MSRPVEEFYRTFHDDIRAKRIDSPYAIRRDAHRAQHAVILAHVRPGECVLDAGCGDGSLALLMAAKGARVIACDISAPNVEAAQARADAVGLARSLDVVQADAQNLPFSAGAFDLVVSSHVLEHLPDLEAGARELRRVSRGRGVIALPTCLNPCAWCLLGGDIYWHLTKRSLYALPLGALRVLLAALRGAEGVDEGYVGHRELPHVWRFPWMVRRRLARAGWAVQSFEASTLALPYAGQYFARVQGLVRWLDRWTCAPGLRYLGYGSTVVVRAM